MDERNHPKCDICRDAYAFKGFHIVELSKSGTVPVPPDKLIVKGNACEHDLKLMLDAKNNRNPELRRAAAAEFTARAPDDERSREICKSFVSLRKSCERAC